MPWLKILHVTCVVLSGSGFALRGYWRLRHPQRLRQWWVRRVPHVVDTVLLGSGISMAVLYHWSPLQQPWLMAKIIALLFYIGLGGLALRQGRPSQIVAALAVFAYIVIVALTKNPLPGFH